MASVDDTKKWNVIVVCDNEEYDQAYRFPRTTQVKEVICRWAHDVNVDADLYQLQVRDGIEAFDTMTLEDYGEVGDGTDVVKLCLQESFCFDLQLFKASGTIQNCKNGCVSYPESMHPTIRQLFDIPSQRLFRLRTLDRPLQYNRTFKDQGLKNNSKLYIDLAFEVDVIYLWEDEVNSFLLYSSEPATDLEIMDPQQTQRLWCHQKRVNTDSDIFDALAPFGGEFMSKFTLNLEVKRCIGIQAGPNIIEKFVWPTDSIKKEIGMDLINFYPTNMMFDGEIISMHNLFADVGMPADALFLTNPLCITVHFSNSKRQVVYLPQDSTVSDLREFIKTKELTRNFSMTVDGNSIGNDDQLLTEVSFIEEKEVLVVINDMIVTVEISSEVLEIPVQGHSMRFSDLVDQVNRRTNCNILKLEKKVFRCKGCGRAISRSEERFQEIPAACCRVRSLEIMEEVPVQTKDFCCQSSASRRIAKCIQPQMTVMQPMFICNYTPFNRRLHYACSLLLPHRARLGDVRLALAEFMGVKREEFDVVRRIGFTRSGGQVSQVCDEEDDPRDNDIFGDNRGRLFKQDCVVDITSYDLIVDKDPFPIIPKRRNVLWVFQKN